MERGSLVLKVINRINKILVVIAQVFVLVLMLVTVANIIARFLGHPIVGAFESGVLMLVFILYLGLAYTQSQHGHVNVDIIINLLPRKTREILAILCLFLGLVILSLMFWQSGLVGLKSLQIREYTPGLIPFPIWPGKLIVPFGLFFFIVQIIVELIQLIYRQVTPGVRVPSQEVKA
jgi:TRAP-type C4-dicarboxylate transport system permease small subunit